MEWFWVLLIFFVVIVGSLWFGYLTEEKMVGPEAARRNSRSATPLFLFWLPLSGFALFFVVEQLGRYGWVSFHILYAVSISAWWMSWFFRKQEAGSLLADVGRTPQSKFLFWIGLLQVALVVFQTWLFFTSTLTRSPEYSSLYLEISRLVLWWSIAGFTIAVGLNKLEFRENGICLVHSLMRWQRINSYTWETDKSNVLTIRFKPRFPLLPSFASLAIPANHQEVVSRILAERLVGKRL
ncbi:MULTISPECIES: DUF5673 domain-containing protein [Trichocoleus]|uniref:DUF5673 domain-containing protein n=1 Tax=Trichocoleus desertorum GB2-A4 TaxID=2933944 RepID=A0ABV0JIS6_9CYAN|nr:DUF5673 domain-containing protein [Trichocoleus sp. FACHB-46]MBD1862361.1 hypothetical protein [Trichocoleus sp. FACHB-46]